MESACLEFGLSFLNLIDKHESMFISPISIFTILSMIFDGSNNNTRQELHDALHFSNIDDETRKKMLKSISEQLFTNSDANFILKSANRVYGTNKYPILDSFLNHVQSVYKSDMVSVDFNNADETASLINSWVENITANKISNLIQPSALTPLTAMVLVNAIYFKGTWEEAFLVERTLDEQFTTLAGKEVTVPMMRQTSGKFGYRDSPELKCKVLSMPYRSDALLSMVIILPYETNGLIELETKLTSKQFDSLTSVSYDYEVEVIIPKFKLETEYSLVPILNEMGIKDLFQPGVADLSNIDGSKELFVSSGIHKAFIDLNEQGSTAAASSAMMVNCFCRVKSQKFIADHPFLFAIVYEKKLPLFLGRFAGPH